MSQETRTTLRERIPFTFNQALMQGLISGNTFNNPGSGLSTSAWEGYVGTYHREQHLRWGDWRFNWWGSQQHDFCAVCENNTYLNVGLPWPKTLYFDPGIGVYSEKYKVQGGQR